ncbi:MAG: hypothetical protein SPK60_04145, partial [Sodaliphilus sp.]|nr:hypothetical protein [Bacteroidales bacterium]MDY5706101.1 hypothetical protein [Sodaliphilus sp.]
RAEAFILPRPLVCYWQRAMAKKTHPHKMVIFLKKNTKKFGCSVRKPIFIFLNRCKLGFNGLNWCFFSHKLAQIIFFVESC